MPATRSSGDQDGRRSGRAADVAPGFRRAADDRLGRRSAGDLAAGRRRRDRGWYLLELPARDNRHLGFLDIAVHPERQRRGLGTALLRHAASRAVADGRRLLTGIRPRRHGRRGLRPRGRGDRGQTEIRRVMDTGALSAERAADLLAGTERASAGYSLVSWTAPTPAEYLDQMAAINRALYDAPHDPSIEELVWDAARVVATDQRIQLQGMRAYTVMARHDATGELGGLTEVEVGLERPEWAFQALTAVGRAHRGHRLGLRLKLAMLELLAQAGTTGDSPPDQKHRDQHAHDRHQRDLGYRLVSPPEAPGTCRPPGSREQLSRRSRGGGAASGYAASPWRS